MDGFRGKKSFAVWLNQSDCAFELLDRNFREAMRYILICSVIDLTASDFPPPFDPSLAKMAFAVPDHQRFRRRIRNAEMH